MTSSLEIHLDECTPEAAQRAIKLRRTLHRHPELGWHEHQTQASIKAYLEALGLAPKVVAGTGLFVDVGEGPRAVLYRADIDALPVQDGKQQGSSPVVSEVEGVCHACGHDMHTAIAAGLLEVFQTVQAKLPGRIRFVFQPSEELLPSGANKLVEEGVAAGMAACLALHCDPMRQVGHVGVRAGPMTASGDSFEIVVRGKGGHAARPYLSRNPILASAQVISALHQIVSQRVDPMEPSVITVTRVQGGTANNVIPDAVVIGGTVRSFSEETRVRLHQSLKEVAESAAAALGCKADVVSELGANCLINDTELNRVVERAAADALGLEAVEQVDRPSTGSEDFSFFAKEAPTYMARLGVRRPGHEAAHLHAPTFDPDEAAIGIGMRVMGRTLLRLLAV